MPTQTTDSPESVPGYRLLKAEIQAAGTGNDKAEAVSDSILEDCLKAIWEMFADKGRRSPRLQYLYASRQTIDFWQKTVWRKVDYDETVKESLGQMSRNLNMIRDAATAEIGELESQLNQASGPAVGQMVQNTALPPLPGQHDPASPYYAGDARQTRRFPYY